MWRFATIDATMKLFGNLVRAHYAPKWMSTKKQKTSETHYRRTSTKPSTVFQN